MVVGLIFILVSLIIIYFKLLYWCDRIRDLETKIMLLETELNTGERFTDIILNVLCKDIDRIKKELDYVKSITDNSKTAADNRGKD